MKEKQLNRVMGIKETNDTLDYTTPNIVTARKFPWLLTGFIVIILATATAVGLYFLYNKNTWNSSKSKLSEYTVQDNVAMRNKKPGTKIIPDDKKLYQAVELYNQSYTKQARQLFYDIVQSDKNPEVKSYALVYLGVIADEEGKFNMALEYYQKAVRHFPRNFFAHYNMAITYRHTAQFDQAIKELELAQKINPDIVDIALLKGEIQYETSDLDAAETTLKNAAEMTQDSLAYYNLGLVYKKEGKLAEAKSVFLMAIESKGSPEARHKAASQLGIISGVQGDYRNAEMYFKQAINLNPSSAKYHYNLALVSHKLNNNAAAIKNLNKAVEKGASNPKTFLYISSLYKEVGKFKEALKAGQRGVALAPLDLAILSEYADTLVKLSMWDQAIETLNKILRNSTKTLERAQAYYNLGIIYKEIGNFAKSKESLEMASKLDPMNEDSMIALGNAYYEAGAPHKSIEMYKKSLRLNPDNISVITALGNLYYKLQLYTEAEELFNRLTKYPNIDSNNIKTSYLSLGKIYKQRKHYDEAIKYFKKSLKSQENDIKYNSLIEISDTILKADYPARDAFDYLDQAIAMKPRDMGARLILSKALLRDGSIRSQEKAEEELSLLIEMGEKPNTLSKAHTLRGIIYYKQGFANKAINDFNIALELDPSNQEAFLNKQAAQQLIETNL